MKAVFLDRDGTMIAETPRERVTRVDELELFPETLDALKLLKEHGYGIVIISNQAGIGEGLITMETFQIISAAMEELLKPSGVQILKTYVCPHVKEDHCDCRKPQPKMILDAAREFDIDVVTSFMVGDRLSDIEAGINAGAQTILVKTGSVAVQAPQATFTAANLLDAARYIVTH